MSVPSDPKPPFILKVWLDSTELAGGSINQQVDITVDPDDIVDEVIKEYLEDLGLRLADVGVYYGEPPANGQYSCMGKGHTFGHDRFYWKKGDTMTIWMRKREYECTDEALKVRVEFVDADEPHDRVFTSSSPGLTLFDSGAKVVVPLRVRIRPISGIGMP